MKKESRFFNIFQFDLEEDYLANQHRQGWAFKTLDFPWTYQFEPCQPQDMTYKLDFKPDQKDLDEYLQLMADYGWEYLGSHYQYTYFRRPANLGQDDFYTDRDSRLSNLNKIVRTRFLVFLLCLSFFLIVDGLENTGNYITPFIVGSLFVILLLVKDYFRLVKKFKGDDPHED